MSVAGACSWSKLVISFMNDMYAQTVQQNVQNFMYDEQEDDKHITTARLCELVRQWVKFNGPAVWSAENRSNTNPSTPIYPEDEEE